MSQDGIAKQVARWVALGALFLIPFTPFIVANSFFFPFITGKAFFFRVLVEIAFGGWVVLALLDRRYRPRFSWVGVLVVAFVLWMFIADSLAVNPLKAFWSNFERMEGWVFLGHLLLLFVAASGVLAVEKKWRAWWLTAVGVSALISIYALFQLFGWAGIHQGSTRIDASLGNSAYLAIYLLFNVFIAGWLALTEKRVWLKWGLIGLALLEGVLIFYTETRGTILGLVSAILLCALLAALVSRGRARRIAAGALALIVILVGGFLVVKNTSFVRNNDILNRIASISLSDGQVRFTIWHMAWQGFTERPLFGWGQEGFNYVFNKYYDPSLYNQEPWFDRAHNAFIDWLIAGGAPAFLLYLALFASALVALWKSPSLSRAERIALTGALAGYACHNLFVFDNLTSYIYFFAVLALVHSQVARPLRFFEQMPELPPAAGATLALPIVGAATLASLLVINLSGLQTVTGLIDAISPQPTGLAANITAFQDLAAHPSFAAQEVREQLVNFALNVSRDSSVPSDLRAQLAALAVTEMGKQVAAYPSDTRTHLELTLAYRAGGDLRSSLAQIEIAQQLSPRKEQILLEEGATRWDLGDLKGAQNDFNKAYELGPQFSALAAYAAAGDIVVGDVATGKQILLKAFGTTVVDNDALALAYYNNKDYPDLIALWQLRANAPGASANAGFGLAAAYMYAGDKQKAIAQVKATIAAHPEAAAIGGQILQQIGAGSGQ